MSNTEDKIKKAVEELFVKNKKQKRSDQYRIKLNLTENEIENLAVKGPYAKLVERRQSKSCKF